MALFSSLARDRFARFKKIKRAWYSFLILSFLFILSLFSELICNDRPYVLCYEEIGGFSEFGKLDAAASSTP
jgi:microcin C transport system permease protein